MKKLIFLNISILRYLFLVFSAFLLCIACNQKTNATASNETIEPIDPMEGVWEQTHSCSLVNGDTVRSRDNSFQHKIYLDGYVMWTADPATDSLEWHGFGTYRYKNDTLIEKLLSMSIPMKDAWGSENEFIFKIDYDGNTFKQVMAGEYNDTIYQNIEVYKKLN